MTSFFSSPWEPDLVLFCGRSWRDRSCTQCLPHALSSGFQQLPGYPKKSGCFMCWALVCDFYRTHGLNSVTLFCCIFDFLVNCHSEKNPTRLLYSYVSYYFSFCDERQASGGNWTEARQWSKPLLWHHEDHRRMNPGDFFPLVWNCLLLHIHYKNNEMYFFNPFMESIKNSTRNVTHAFGLSINFGLLFLFFSSTYMWYVSSIK